MSKQKLNILEYGIWFARFYLIYLNNDGFYVITYAIKEMVDYIWVLFPSATLGWETRDFQLRHKIGSSKQKLLDKKHAWSKVIGSNFLLLFFTWILMCGGVLSVIQKDTLCEKTFSWDKEYTQYGL